MPPYMNVAIETFSPQFNNKRIDIVT